MNKSSLIAVALTLGATVWVVGGFLLKSPEPKTVDAPRKLHSSAPMTVSVREQEARQVQRYIVAQGQAEPNRSVIVRAETAGQIAEILADEGARLTGGDLIARLKPNERQARFERAQARVRQQQGAFDASQALGKKGYQTQRQSDEAFAALQTAKAELEEARIELEHLRIRAPFEGILLTSKIELGAYVAVNGEVATIVDNDPLVVSVRIPQQDIGDVQPGLPATIAFAVGGERDGKVRYVAARADDDTRTFRIEIEVPNPRGEIPSGISAEARIPTRSVPAHFVSPAALSLDDDGILGVKTVDENSKVAFHAAKIVRSDTKGVWISGLPAHARIITMGQGFVRIGETVRAAEEDGAKTPDAARRAPVRVSKTGPDARPPQP